MIGRVLHIGLTVSDLERSRHFYQNILGLRPDGQLRMAGPDTDRLFGEPDAAVDILYFKGSDHLLSPPLELICFDRFASMPPDQDRTAALSQIGISEVCLETDDIQREYQRLSALGVDFLSPPVYFDFRPDGFYECYVVYFKDPDGIILELIQML